MRGHGGSSPRCATLADAPASRSDRPRIGSAALHYY